MKQLFTIVMFLALGTFHYAQENDTLKKVTALDEVIIAPFRIEEKRALVPYSVEVIKARDIAFQNPQTSADLLTNTGSVFVQKSQQGGGSPVLRGFEASRVLLVIDGVRMNNAIYRSGHLQDIITLDNSMLDHVEVLFGPSSTMYGSDALGGVVHFFTKKPLFGEEKLLIKSNSFLRWSSANNEKSGHVDINFGGKNLAVLTSVTFSDFDDLRTGNNRDYVYDQFFIREYYAERINGVDSMVRNPDRNIQKNSGYFQYDILQKLAFKQNENALHTMNLQFSNSSNINRYDRLTEYSGANLRFAEWYYGPQKRMLASLKSDFSKQRKLSDKITTVIAVQSVNQERVDRRFKDVNKYFQRENVKVFSVNADLFKRIDDQHELGYGGEAVHNIVSSTAKRVNIETFDEAPAATRYPDAGSTMSSVGFYLSHRYKISDKLTMSDGIRFGLSRLSANFEDTTFYPFPFEDIQQKNSSLTGNLGIVYRPKNDLKISALASTGFRTPNVDDLTKIFDSSPGMLIVANPELEPEKAYNMEVSVEKTFSNKISFLFTGWYTYLDDAMVLKKSSYKGADSVLYNGVRSQVMTMQNANNGYISGISGTFTTDFNEQFSFKTSATYTYGRYHDTENDTIIPLDHIPPAFGRTSLFYKFKKIESEFFVVYNGWKLLKDYSPSGEDNLKYATPYGMPSWITLNARVSFRMNRHITIQSALENIMDTHYRFFASGISAPGRNFSFTIRGRF